MRIRFQEIDGIAVIAADCSILQEHVPLLRSRLGELLVAGKNRVVLDMTEVAYISSMGLAVIVDAKNHLMRGNGDLRMATVNSLVMNLLNITNLAKKIRVFNSVPEAIASFQAAQFPDR